MLKFIHSYFAYIVIALLIISTLRFLFRYALSKEYTPTDFRLALITFIVSHTHEAIFILREVARWYISKSSSRIGYFRINFRKRN